MKVLITQSNYIPWKGYFDAINMADLFILYDDMQFTKRDWRNRNKIKTKDGLQWLSIPVETKNRYHQLIRETRVASDSWREKHWKSIMQAYSTSRYFKEYNEQIHSWYDSAISPFLSEINLHFLTQICKLLKIETPMRLSSEFAFVEGKTDRLVNLCQQVGATEYITGPAARNYLEEGSFTQAGISVHYMDYSWYPEYQQLHGSFVHQVSVLDVIFNVGPEARAVTIRSDSF